MGVEHFVFDIGAPNQVDVSIPEHNSLGESGQKIQLIEFLNLIGVVYHVV